MTLRRCAFSLLVLVFALSLRAQGHRKKLYLREKVLQLGKLHWSHMPGTTCAALSPKGRYLALGDQFSAIRIWEVKTGKHLRTLRGHASSIVSLTFAANGSQIASGDFGGNLILWDFESGKLLQKFSNGLWGGGVLSLPESTALLAWSIPGQLQWWSIKTGRARRTWSLTYATASSLALHQWCKTRPLVAMATDLQVAVYDRTARKQVGSVIIPGAPANPEEGTEDYKGPRFRAASFSDNELSLLTIDSEATIRTYSLSLKLLSTEKISPFPVDSARFSPASRILALKLRQKNGFILQLFKKAKQRWKRLHSRKMAHSFSFSFSRDQNRLVLSSEEGASLLHVENGNEITSPPDPQQFSHSALSRDGSLLATYSRDGFFRLWNPVSGAVIRKWKAKGRLSREPFCLCAKGTRLVAIDEKGQVQLWNTTTGSLTRLSIPPHRSLRRWRPGEHPLSSRAQVFTVSSNGSVLATRGKSAITLWQLPEGKEIRSFTCRSARTPFQLSGDGRLLALMNDKQNRLEIRDSQTGQLKTSRHESTRPVILTFSPDGKYLACEGTGFELSPVAHLERSVASQGWWFHPESTSPPCFDGPVVIRGVEKQLSFVDRVTGRDYHQLPIPGDAPIASFRLKSGSDRLITLDLPGQMKVLKISDQPPREQKPVEKTGFDVQGDPLPRQMAKRLGSTRFRIGGSRFQRNSSPTNAALSPDGRLLAAPSQITANGELCLLDATSGKTLRKLDLAPYADGPVCFTPNGKSLVALDSDLLQMWDVSTGKQQWSFHLDQGTGRALALSPNGKWVAIGEDETIHLLDAQNGKACHSWKQNTGYIRLLSFSEDSSRLYVGVEEAIEEKKEDRFVLIPYNCRTGKRLSQHEMPFPAKVTPRAIARNGQWFIEEKFPWEWLFRYDSGKVTEQKLPPSTAMTFSDNGNRVILAGEETIEIRAIPTLKILQKIPLPMRVDYLHCSQNGKRLLGLAYQEDPLAGGNHPGCLTVCIWDLTTGKLLLPDSGHSGPIRSLVWSSDSRRLISASKDGTTRFWNVKTGKEEKSYRRRSTPLSHLALSPNGKALVGIEPDGMLSTQLRKKPLGKRCGFTRRYREPLVEDACFLSNDQLVLVRRKGRVSIYSLAKGKPLQQSHLKEALNSFAIDRRSQLLIGGVTYPTLSSFDPPTGTIHGIRLSDQQEVFSYRLNMRADEITLSPNGRLFAIESKSSSAFLTSFISIRETVTGKEIFRISVSTECVAWSRDSRFLLTATSAAAGLDYTSPIHALSMATGSYVKSWTGHRGLIYTMAVSPNGKILATGGSDHTISLWDLSGLKDPPRKPVAWSRADMARLWRDLASEDAATAHNALWDLVASPRQAVPLLRRHLRPVPRPDAAQVRQWLRDLDDRGYVVRERARRALEGLGHRARPFLLEAKKAKPALEMRKRLDRLLGRLGPVRSARELQIIRAVSTLEYIRTEKATALLRSLAKGDPAAFLTQEAIASLEQIR